MKLSKLLDSISYQGVYEDCEITDIVYDSRKVTLGSLFICLRGSVIDGHCFAQQAADEGASVILAEEKIDASVPVILVHNTRKAMAWISAAFFSNPSLTDIKVIGITGTKGKTTAACMIRSILEASGQKTGMIGTIGVEIGNEITQIENTTPASYEVQKFLRLMADAGCKYCVMEVSSIGLRDDRVLGVNFELGAFTNFSEDHIGGTEHKDMKEYLKCKSMLFKLCKIGVINVDDPNSKALLKNHTCEVYTYGMTDTAQIRGKGHQLLSKSGFLGISFNVCGDLNFTVEVGVPGRFNEYNALTAIACCHVLELSTAFMQQGLQIVKVKGRMEPVAVPGAYTLLIDYAHNAVSMESMLKTLREYNPRRLVCMFGAGGNRSKTRRFDMGEVSGRLADLSVITSDNPRDEEPLDIIADIITGMKKTSGKYTEIPDRKEAIRFCLENAQDGDIIVLAGKGHEDYQEIRGKKYQLDERVVIADILKGH